jgi:beta-xylosidase-like protein
MVHMKIVPPAGTNLWTAPNLLLQKLPARESTVTTLVDASGLQQGDRTGLLMMGRDYSYLAVVRTANGLRDIHRAAGHVDRRQSGIVFVGIRR